MCRHSKFHSNTMSFLQLL